MSSLSSHTTTGWAARDASGVLSPYTYTLRRTGPWDVLIKVLYCGICHTDIHQTRNHLGRSRYPMVPGQEVVGEVMEVGKDVRRFLVGDMVGAGVLVGCCRECGACKAGEEQYCSNRVCSYNDVDADGKPTYGGLASAMVVDQMFLVKIPAMLAPEQAAPLLCAGLTVYSPLKNFGLKGSGLSGAIVGLGGVGHVGVKIAKAMGHHVTVISSSEKKRVEAIDHVGADDFLVSTDEAQMAAAAEKFDYIIDTVPGFHELEPLLSLLKVGGRIILLGIINQPLHFLTTSVILGRKSITASFIGSMEEMQELLDFSAQSNLTFMIEMVKMEEVNEALERLERNNVKYRIVVDVANSRLDI